MHDIGLVMSLDFIVQINHWNPWTYYGIVNGGLEVMFTFLVALGYYRTTLGCFTEHIYSYPIFLLLGPIFFLNVQSTCFLK